MKHLLIFVENYVAGGADKMARIYADSLGAEKMTILYNHDDDPSVLLQAPLSPHISPIPYSIPTIARLGAFANHYRKIPPLFVFLKLFNLIIRYPLWFFAFFYFFCRFLILKPSHIIINNGGYPGGEWCRTATISAKLYSFVQSPTPIIHIIHSRATKPFFFLFAPIEYLIDYLVDKSSKLVCVSHENAETLKKVRFIKQEVQVIYTGVEIHSCKNYPPLSNRPLKLLNVASLYSIKNQILILQSLVELGNHDIELHLVGKEGEDGYLDMLQEYAKLHNLKVFFHGFCNPQPFYEKCDVFVLSSLVEGFPLVTLEAMSYGMPIVTTKCGGAIEQIINNYNGLLIDASMQSLAQAITFFINHPQEIEKMGKNAYQHMQKHFAFDKMIEKYGRLLSCFIN